MEFNSKIGAKAYASEIDIISDYMSEIDKPSSSTPLEYKLGSFSIGSQSLHWWARAFESQFQIKWMTTSTFGSSRCRNSLFSRTSKIGTCRENRNLGQTCGFGGVLDNQHQCGKSQARKVPNEFRQLQWSTSEIQEALSHRTPTNGLTSAASVMHFRRRRRGEDN